MENCIDVAYRAVLNAQQLRNNKIGRGFPVLTKPPPASDDHPRRVALGGCGSSSGVVSAFAIATLPRAFPTLPASAAANQPCSCTMRVHDRRLVHGHAAAMHFTIWAVASILDLHHRRHRDHRHRHRMVNRWALLCVGRRPTPRDAGSLAIARSAVA